MKESIILFADSNRGQYIPQHFAESIDRSKVKYVSDDDWQILEAGPDHNDYWECWDDVTRDAEVIDGGYTYTIHNDGDLFLVSLNHISPQEYRDLFGDEPDREYWENFAAAHDCLLYTLPVYWASYLVNNDPSGLEDSEIAEADSFIDREKPGFCVDVSEPWFSHTNDANNLGGDVAYFIFDGGK